MKLSKRSNPQLNPDEIALINNRRKEKEEENCKELKNKLNKIISALGSKQLQQVVDFCEGTLGIDYNSILEKENADYKEWLKGHIPGGFDGN